MRARKHSTAAINAPLRTPTVPGEDCSTGASQRWHQHRDSLTHQPQSSASHLLAFFSWLEDNLYCADKVVSMLGKIVGCTQCDRGMSIVTTSMHHSIVLRSIRYLILFLNRQGPYLPESLVLARSTGNRSDNTRLATRFDAQFPIPATLGDKFSGQVP